MPKKISLITLAIILSGSILLAGPKEDPSQKPSLEEVIWHTSCGPTFNGTGPLREGDSVIVEVPQDRFKGRYEGRFVSTLDDEYEWGTVTAFKRVEGIVTVELKDGDKIDRPIYLIHKPLRKCIGFSSH